MSYPREGERLFPGWLTDRVVGYAERSAERIAARWGDAAAAELRDIVRCLRGKEEQ